MIYADCNTISPATLDRVAAAIAPTECPFADTGIIGPGLGERVLEGPAAAALAFKMSYAGIAKGTTAIGAAMILASKHAGCADELFNKLQFSQNDALVRFGRQLPRVPPRAHRWVAECTK
jgi:uncharacterized protein DUF1932